MKDPVNILLVDDEPGMLRYIRTLLEVDSYKVETANSGNDALERVQRGLTPDLVLLDLDLSGAVTGWDVLKALRSTSSAPVLLTSAESAVRRHIRTQGESRSTLDHLPKPYHMEALLKRIERMLAITP